MIRYSIRLLYTYFQVLRFALFMYRFRDVPNMVVMAMNAPAVKTTFLSSSENVSVFVLNGWNLYSRKTPTYR